MENKSKGIDKNFFDAAFQCDLSENKDFIPISDERGKEILLEALDFHDKVYLPAEKLTEEKLGRKLDYFEQLFLHMELTLLNLKK